MTGQHNVDPLSPEGQSRRDAMLSDMLRLVNVTRARRRRRRQAASAATMLVLAIALIRVGQYAGPIDRHAENRDAGGRGPAHAMSTGVLVERVADSGVHLTERIRDDATIVERFQSDTPRRIIWLDDEGLLAELASMRRPSGLVRYGGQIRLTAAVTDDDWGLRR